MSRLFVRLSLFVNLAFSLISVTCSQTVQAQAYSRDGVAVYAQRQDYQGMLAYCQAWTRASPNDPSAWANLGTTYGIYLKQPERAVPPMKRSLELNPNQAGGWNALGITYEQLNRHLDAANAIEKAIHINPDQPTYYNNLAAAYSGMAHWDSAAKALDDEKPLAIRLHRADVWYVLGNAQLQLQSSPNAIEAYKQALRIQPDLAAAWTNLGNAFAFEENFQNAYAAYHKGTQYGDPLAAKGEAITREREAEIKAVESPNGGHHCGMGGERSAYCTNYIALYNDAHMNGRP